MKHRVAPRVTTVGSASDLGGPHRDDEKTDIISHSKVSWGSIFGLEITVTLWF